MEQRSNWRRETFEDHRQRDSNGSALISCCCDPFPKGKGRQRRSFRQRREAIKGRGSTGALPRRYAVIVREKSDDGRHDGRVDGDGFEDIIEPLLRTQVREEIARSIISRNTSPDIGFSQSVNP